MYLSHHLASHAAHPVRLSLFVASGTTASNYLQLKMVTILTYPPEYITIIPLLYSSGQLLQSVFGHKSLVTCLALDHDSGLCSSVGDGLVASGAHDATVLLWTWSGRLNRVVTQLRTSKSA